MNKQEFLGKLRNGLSSLPQNEIEERLNFYSEVIDDRMEEGLSETDAVAAIGSVETIISQIVAEVPLTKLAKEKIVPRRKWNAWEVMLLVLGSPIWFSLIIATIAVIFSFYASIWAVIVSLWAVFGSLVACTFGLILAGIVFIVYNMGLAGGAMFSASLISAGFSIFMFFGCKAISKGTAILTKRLVLCVKNRFVKGEA
jgi:uncharacterized membrane protein